MHQAEGGYTPAGFQSKTVITSRSRRKWEKRISGVSCSGPVMEVAPGTPYLGPASPPASRPRWFAPDHPGAQPRPWAPLFHLSPLNCPQATAGEWRLLCEAPELLPTLSASSGCWLSHVRSSLEQKGAPSGMIGLSFWHTHVC